MISVINGLERRTLNLCGIGIQRKLKIYRNPMNFPTVVPSVQIVEDYFVIKNDNPFSAELFWGHLTE